MPAKSKSQQRFFAMVRQCQKTGDCASDSVKKAAGNINKKDAKKYAETKHKGLPEKVTEGKMTFIEFLTEIDAGDHAIRQSIELDKQRQTDADQLAADDKKVNNSFKDRMANATPSKGDIIQSKTGYYIITNMDREGLHVKQAGGDKSGIIPHGTKFKNVGKTVSGKPKFAVI